jgi:hypothetical protein
MGKMKRCEFRVDLISSTHSSKQLPPEAPPHTRNAQRTCSLSRCLAVQQLRHAAYTHTDHLSSALPVLSIDDSNRDNKNFLTKCGPVSQKK